MAMPPGTPMGSCSIYRPFGDAVPTHTGVSCRLIADFARGRLSAGGIPEWTHFLELAVDADIKDGCTRTAGAYVPTYADGDEVRMSVGGSTQRFVVVWVEVVDPGSDREFKRAYLLRHAA